MQSARTQALQPFAFVSPYLQSQAATLQQQYADMCSELERVKEQLRSAQADMGVLLEEKAESQAVQKECEHLRYELSRASSELELRLAAAKAVPSEGAAQGPGCARVAGVFQGCGGKPHALLGVGGGGWCWIAGFGVGANGNGVRLVSVARSVNFESSILYCEPLQFLVCTFACVCTCVYVCVRVCVCVCACVRVRARADGTVSQRQWLGCVPTRTDKWALHLNSHSSLDPVGVCCG